MRSLENGCAACEADADRAADAALASGACAPPIPVGTCGGGGAGTLEAPDEVRSTLQSAGRPLDATTQRFFASRYDWDFSRVRIHSDSDAERSAASVGAYAYTVGEHVVLPRSHEPRLLAHELAHVVQQGGAGATPMLQREQRKTKPLAITAPFSGWVIAGGELEIREDRSGAYRHTGQDEARVCEVPNPAAAKHCDDLAPGTEVKVTRVVVPPVVYEDNGQWYPSGGAGWYEIERPDRPGKKGYVLGVFIEARTAPPPEKKEKKKPSGLDLPEAKVPEKPPGPKRTDPDALKTFCKPFSTKEIALRAHALNKKILMDFTAKFGADVQELWRTYMDTPKVGTKGVLPERKLFGDKNSRVVKEFQQDPETVQQRDILFKKILEKVKANPDQFVPPVNRSTGFLPITTPGMLSDSDRLDLPMSFKDPTKRIPALIAGGPGKNSSDAGDDVRNIDGVFAVTTLEPRLVRLQMSLTLDVQDCIDFCPGAAGSLKAQLGLTDDLSRLEATPDVPTYDTPFEVIAGGLNADENVKI